MKRAGLNYFYGHKARLGRAGVPKRASLCWTGPGMVLLTMLSLKISFFLNTSLGVVFFYITKSALKFISIGISRATVLVCKMDLSGSACADVRHLCNPPTVSIKIVQ